MVGSFEYTTLLSFVLSDGFDYLVLEAGLGGEFDATNVVKSDLSKTAPCISLQKMTSGGTDRLSLDPLPPSGVFARPIE